MNRKMKRIASFSLVALLAGCAHHEVVESSQPASTTEKRTANVSYLNCLTPYAQRLDDGKSDAKTIAQAMRGACPTELESVYETMSRGENNAVKGMMRQQLASIEESSALQVVLNARHPQTR